MSTVYIYPEFLGEDRADGGVRRVVEAQRVLLPKFGWNVVDSPDDADVIAIHIQAGDRLLERYPQKPVAIHNHGGYWAEYDWKAEWYDKANAKTCIQYDEGTVDCNTSLGGGVPHDNTGAFNVGYGTLLSRYWDGWIDTVYFWKNEVPPTADLTAIWNSGKGVECEAVSTGASCWDLDEDGGPYIIKPRFFGSEEAWGKAPKLDGFYMERSASRDLVLGRFKGREYRVEASSGRISYSGEGFTLHFREDDVEGTIEGDCAGEVDLTYYYIMDLLRRAVCDSRQVNYINSLVPEELES